MTSNSNESNDINRLRSLLPQGVRGGLLLQSPSPSSSLMRKGGSSQGSSNENLNEGEEMAKKRKRNDNLIGDRAGGGGRNYRRNFNDTPLSSASGGDGAVDQRVVERRRERDYERRYSRQQHQQQRQWQRKQSYSDDRGPRRSTGSDNRKAEGCFGSRSCSHWISLDLLLRGVSWL